jgi:hypothetical protein
MDPARAGSAAAKPVVAARIAQPKIFLMSCFLVRGRKNSRLASHCCQWQKGPDLYE